jgi:peroxiredoxin
MMARWYAVPVNRMSRRTTMTRHDLTAGELLPAFRLAAANRPGPVGLWEYKQRSSLVVLLLHGASCAPCLARLEATAAIYDEVRATGAEVLAILNDDLESLGRLARDVPFPLLADARGDVRAKYVDGGVALVLADQYNALFQSWAAPDADRLPDATELREWLTFLELQCEECHPPVPSEWPLQ